MPSSVLDHASDSELHKVAKYQEMSALSKLQNEIGSPSNGFHKCNKTALLQWKNLQQVRKSFAPAANMEYAICTALRPSVES